MDKNEIIRMAREAGFETKVLNSIDGEEVLCFDPLITDMLKDFAALVAAHEREACAKVCDAVLGENNVSAAIRARGEK